MLLPTLSLLVLSLLGSSAEEYPSPHIVLVGKTGSGVYVGPRIDHFMHECHNLGKSSLANALLGCDPRGDNDCMFGVCGGLDSCTKNTTIGTGQWLGDADSYTVSSMIKFYNQK